MQEKMFIENEKLKVPGSDSRTDTRADNASTDTHINPEVVDFSTTFREYCSKNGKYILPGYIEITCLAWVGGDVIHYRGEYNIIIKKDVHLEKIEKFIDGKCIGVYTTRSGKMFLSFLFKTDFHTRFLSFN